MSSTPTEKIFYHERQQLFKGLCRCIANQTVYVQGFPYSFTRENKVLKVSRRSGRNPVVRILIADDHDGTRSVLRVLLEGHNGWEICGEAATNSEALQKAIELKPDVLLKDWVMPGVSNLEVTAQIAKLLPETTIVLFSFYDIPQLEGIAKAAGVNSVASKDLSSLIAAIESALRSSVSRHLATTEAPAGKKALKQSEDLE